MPKDPFEYMELSWIEQEQLLEKRRVWWSDTSSESSCSSTSGEFGEFLSREEMEI
jgi:hypothetical protein